MYSDLDDLLSQDTTIDAWYDDGFLIARDLLNDFSENDWNMLNNSLMSKDLEWQKKLAYAISNKINIDELNVLLKLLQIHNEELIEICLDSLRLYAKQEFKEIIKANSSVLKIINNKNNFSSNFLRMIIGNYKINAIDGKIEGFDIVK